MLFSVPPTQVAVQRSYDRVFYPKNPLAGNGAIRFEIPPNPAFLDVSHNSLYCKFRIVRADNGNMDCDDQVGPPVVPARDFAAPINYIGNTFFKQLKIYAGGKLLWDSGDTYHYKALLEALMGFDITTKQTYLKSALFVQDEAGTDADNAGANRMDDHAHNTGVQARAVFAWNSAEFETMAAIHADPFNQEKLFPNRMDLAIELYRNAPEFTVITGMVHNYRLQLIDCRFYMRMVETAPTLAMAFESQLLKTPAKIPIRRTEIKVHAIELGRQELPSTHLHTGQLPRRIILGLVRADAFLGAYALNPFNFKNFDLSRISISAGGIDYPPTPLELNFAENQYVQGYHMLYEALKGNADSKSCGITWKEFRHGYALYCFDLSPDSSGSSGYFQLISEGTVELKLRFANALAQAVAGAQGIRVLSYMEFDNIISIDRFRQPHMDYII